MIVENEIVTLYLKKNARNVAKKSGESVDMQIISTTSWMLEVSLVGFHISIHNIINNIICYLQYNNGKIKESTRADIVVFVLTTNTRADYLLLSLYI